MNRTLDATNLVRLPVLSAADAIALGAALETRAEDATPLPANIEEARADLADTHDQLKRAFERQGHAKPSGRPLIEVDRSLDKSWGAAHDLCAAWMRLPLASVQKTAATRIHEALFKDGLTFTQLKCRDQWVESQLRLDMIVEQDMEQCFVTLAAQDILDALRAFHQEYGDVQGLTAPVEDQPLSVAENLQSFRETLRFYVLQVVAHARPRDPLSQERARTLLMPLSTWQSRRRSNAEEATDGEDAAGDAAGDAVGDAVGDAAGDAVSDQGDDAAMARPRSSPFMDLPRPGRA